MHPLIVASEEDFKRLVPPACTRETACAACEYAKRKIPRKTAWWEDSYNGSFGPSGARESKPHMMSDRRHTTHESWGPLGEGAPG